MKKQNDYQRQSQLLALPDNAVIGKQELAVLLGIAEQTISGLLHRGVDLPRRWPGPTKKVQWRMADVRHWIQERGAATSRVA